MPNIYQQLADKEQELVALRSKARAVALAEIQQRILDLNVQPGEIRWPARPRSKYKPKGPDMRAVVPAKFRDDETGQTWSGRGSMPTWLAQRVAQGKTIADYTVTRQDAQKIEDALQAAQPADGDPLAAESGGDTPAM